MFDKLKNPSNIYFVLWTLYSLQGSLYAKGSLLSQILLLFILLISLRETLTFIYNNRVVGYFQILNVLMAMYTFYGLLLFLTDGMVVHGMGGRNVQSMNFLKTFYMSILPIYVNYIYTVKGYLSLPLLKCWMVVFLFLGINEYYCQQNELLQKLLAAGSSKEEVTNNAGYVLLSLVPGMLVYKSKPIIFYIGIAICVVYILMGMKRGAILVCAVSLFLIAWRDLKSAKGKYKISVLVVIILSFVVLYGFVENLMTHSDYFNDRLEATLEGNTSRRDDLYMIFVNAFTTESNFFQMLFGRGACGTIKYSYNYAHNDWLEILTNQGVLGVTIFAFYWYCFWKESRSLKYCEESKFCLSLLFYILGLKTLFSMSICSMELPITVMLGFCLADGFRTAEMDRNE